MLTVEEIRSMDFPKAGMNGYKAADVNYFLDEIAEQIENSEKQKNELLQKLQILAETIEEYRGMEDSVKSAILSAQKTGDAILREAKEKAQTEYEANVRESRESVEKAHQTADSIIAEANEKAKAMLDEAALRKNALLSEAEEKAKAMLSEADKKTGQLMLQYNYVKDEVKRFKDTVLEQYKNHIDMIVNMPTVNKNIETTQKKDN